MSTYEVDWYRTSLSQSQLHDLNSRSNLRGCLQAGGHLGLLAATGSLAFTAGQRSLWIPFVLALIAHGLIASFAINALHELAHGTVFRSNWLNSAFLHTFSFLSWINHHAFWASHAEHHRFTLHYPYDREVVLPVVYTWKDFISRAIVSPQILARRMRIAGAHAAGRIPLDESGSDWHQELLAGQRRRFAVFRWARVMILGHLIVATMSIYYGLWTIPLLVSLTPAFGGVLFFLLNETQHIGLQGGSDDFRLNSRTIEVAPVFGFLYWHMNFHIEHHMYAAVPCYNLETLHRLIERDLPPPPSGIVQTWFHIIGVMYRQQVDPNYEYQPALPGATAQETTRPVTQPPSAKLKYRPTHASLRIWECTICGFVYDEAVGIPEEGIPPGTKWADIPASWVCPDCGTEKSDFEMVDIT